MSPRPAPRTRLKRWLAYAAAVSAAAMFLGGAWRLWPSEPPRGRPAIAVLPFASMGGDAVTGRLADGITEDIVTDLARFRELDVIARNSTAVYQGKPVDVRQVGEDLNVGHVLEGSIQRQAERVRVTAQLIDAPSDAHVWSVRWDRPTQDVFAVQSELADAVASRLGGYGQIAGAERAAAKRKRPSDLTAYDLHLLGSEQKHRLTKEGAEAADRVIRIDPNLRAVKSGGVSRAYFMVGRYEDALRELTANPEETLGRMNVILKAGSLASLDRVDEAKAVVARALGRFPDLTVEGVAGRPDFIEHERKRFVETMRKAGFPACASAQDIAKLAHPVRLPEREAERAKAAAAKSRAYRAPFSMRSTKASAPSMWWS